MPVLLGTPAEHGQAPCYILQKASIVVLVEGRIGGLFEEKSVTETIASVYRLLVVQKAGTEDFNDQTQEWV